MTEEEQKQWRDLFYKQDQTSGGLEAGEVTSLNALINKKLQSITLAP